MGRKPRVEYEGAIYHVIQRGNNGEHILENDADKLFLLRELERSKQDAGLRLFGYVLMGNHYHLIVQTMDSPMSKVMHRVNGCFSRQYNRKQRRSGPNFEGRYRAILIEDERYLLAVLRYVHQNPVRAGICRRIADYQWSSDQYYRRNQYGLVDIDLILDCLSDNRREAIKHYVLLMNEIDEDQVDYGATDAVSNDRVSHIARSECEKAKREGLDDILRDTGVSGDDFSLIKEGSRKRHLVPYKIAYVRKALEQNYTLKEIGAHVCLTDAAAFKLSGRST
ncbi:MAG: transposase [Candidatus Desulforudis sp.]|nr:transposase [Desulforudis sp.]